MNVSEARAHTTLLPAHLIIDQWARANGGMEYYRSHGYRRRRVLQKEAYATKRGVCCKERRVLQKEARGTKRGAWYKKKVIRGFRTEVSIPTLSPRMGPFVCQQNGNACSASPVVDT